ncbi:MAG: hypothetical protein KDA96_28440, partial [Planctomycetaceae bacterium]|nr:hypothetical protein [Planctomycetaceae bacterium]
MSAQGIHLDPEVEGLLREIAADPGSSLLRVERPKTLRPLLEREHAAGARMAGLTNAERHLLERYRDEVGYALLWG